MKLTENEERLLLSAKFTAKFELVLVLTQENAFFRGFILQPTEKAYDLLKNNTRGYFQNSHSFERLACLCDNHNILNVSNPLTLKKNS